MPDRTTLAVTGLINRVGGLDGIYSDVGDVKDIVDALIDAITGCINMDSASTSSTTYVKILETTIPAGFSNATLHISFRTKVYTQAGHPSKFKIYRNAGAVGTEMSSETNEWQTQKEEITGWTAGDTLELWAHRHSSIAWATTTGQFLLAKVP